MGFATPQCKNRKQWYDNRYVREAEVDLFAFVRGAVGFGVAMSAFALPFLLAGIIRF